MECSFHIQFNCPECKSGYVYHSDDNRFNFGMNLYDCSTCGSMLVIHLDVVPIVTVYKTEVVK